MCCVTIRLAWCCPALQTSSSGTAVLCEWPRLHPATYALAGQKGLQNLLQGLWQRLQRSPFLSALLKHDARRAAGRPGDAASTAPGEPAPDLHYGPEWVVLLFEKPMLAPTNSIFLGTRMDMALDDSEPACRVAFYGNVVHVFKACVDHKQLRLYKVLAGCVACVLLQLCLCVLVRHALPRHLACVVPSSLV